MLGHVLVALALLAGTDQSVQVRKGMRLEVHNFMGDISIKTWDRDSVRVETGREDDVVELRPTGNSLLIRPRGSSLSRSIGRSFDLAITVPNWMAIEVNGVNSDVTIDGAGADVSVETMRGDIKLLGGTGFVSMKSFQGNIVVEKAKGRIEIEGINQGVRLIDVNGDISVGTMNGSITMDRIETSNLDVSSVNGSIAYGGPINDRGTYRLTTHNGTLGIAIQEKVNATVRVRTYSGNFRSSFPVRIEDQNRQNRFTLTLGTGSARVELESFNGSISLVRPGEPLTPPGRNRNDRNRDNGNNPRRGPAPPPAPNPVPAPAPPPPPNPR